MTGSRLSGLPCQGREPIKARATKKIWNRGLTQIRGVLIITLRGKGKDGEKIPDFLLTSAGEMLISVIRAGSEPMRDIRGSGIQAAVQRKAGIREKDPGENAGASRFIDKRIARGRKLFRKRAQACGVGEVKSLRFRSCPVAGRSLESEARLSWGKG